MQVRVERALDETSGWESIVNNVERRNARSKWEEKRHSRKRNKMKQIAINLSLGAVLSTVLACTGLLASYIAIPAAVVLVCVASLVVGRLLEGSRK